MPTIAVAIRFRGWGNRGKDCKVQKLEIEAGGTLTMVHANGEREQFAMAEVSRITVVTSQHVSGWSTLGETAKVGKSEWPTIEASQPNRTVGALESYDAG